jgi:hypothetical protein
MLVLFKFIVLFGSTIQPTMRSSAPKPISQLRNKWVIGLGSGFRMSQWKADEKTTALNERKTYEHVYEIRLHLLRAAHGVQTPLSEPNAAQCGLGLTRPIH